MSQLSVAYVTQWFPPEPAYVPLWIAQALRRQGLDVQVVTGMPNYPSGIVHPGYQAWRSRIDRIDGFSAYRVPLVPGHSRSAIGRVVNYGSFAATSSLLTQRLLRGADVSLVYSSPATAASASLLARVLGHTPYVVLIQDLWPDSIFATGFLTTRRSRWLIEGALSRASLATYRHAAAVAVIAPGMKNLLIARGLNPAKVHVVYNWADESLFRPTTPDPSLRALLGIGDDLMLMYAGNHGAAQALSGVIDAMSAVRDIPVHLVFVGDGVDKPHLMERAKAQNLERVHFMDPVPLKRIPGLMAASDVQLISLADEQLFHITVPGKVQCTLACGLPSIVAAPGDAATIFRDAGAGFVCPPGDPRALADAIRRAAETPRDQLARMGESGRQYYLDNLSEAKNAGLLATLLAEAAQDREGRRRAP